MEVAAQDSRAMLIMRRWLLIAATLPVLAALAPSWSWFSILGMSVVMGAMSIHLFGPAVFDHWVESGRLLFADTLLVGFALLGTAHPRPTVLAGYFVVVLLATLASDRFKTLLGTIALGGMLAAMAVSGALQVSPLDALFVPLLGAAALVPFRPLIVDDAPPTVDGYLDGRNSRVEVVVPMRWLAGVWARGAAVVEGRLVLDVDDESKVATTVVWDGAGSEGFVPRLEQRRLTRTPDGWALLEREGA